MAGKTEQVVSIAKKAKELERSLDKAEARKQFGEITIQLSEQAEWMGETYTELTMNFNGLTGADMEAIDDELTAMGMHVPPFPASSRRYQRLFAARAAGVPSDMIEQLSVMDYNKICTAARNFLLLSA